MQTHFGGWINIIFEDKSLFWGYSIENTDTPWKERGDAKQPEPTLFVPGDSIGFSFDDPLREFIALENPYQT